MRRVVVTGVGLVSPLGPDRESGWRALVDGSSATDPEGGRAPLIDDGGPRAVTLALAAAGEAWRNAGLKDAAGIGGERLGCLVSSSKPLPPTAPGGPWRAPDEVPTAVARALGAEGPVMNLAAACATGAQSLLAAAGWIAEGRADVVLAGAAESALHPLYRAGFAQMGVLSKAGRVRSFDRDRDGFMMGEGAAVFVLESVDSAAARGARIWAEVLGGDFSSDAHHATRFNGNGERMTACLRRALTRAGLTADDLDYVNAHGTATLLNDALESQALRRLFPRGTTPVSSTKGATGHLLGATGAVEISFTLLALRDGVLPPTLHLEHPVVPDMDFVPNRARPANLRRAASVSYGFGGALSAVVLGTA